MSAYSTLYITRQKAINIILNKLMGGISDEELKELMNKELEHRLYRVCIVSDNSENDDDKI